MIYELNARICLPASMGKAQICELNVGRYNSLDGVMGAKGSAEADHPHIVMAVLDTLYEELDVAPKGLVTTYFTRAI